MTTLYTYETSYMYGKNGTTGQYKFRATIELNSQNIQNNSSNVTATLVMFCNDDSGSLLWNASSASNQPYGLLEGNLPVTGNRIAKYYKTTTPLVLATYTKDIPHEADGTKTINETFKWVAGGLNYYPDSFTVATATNIALTTIPRASTVSVSNALITDNTGSLSYTITASASFYHKLDLSFNGHEDTLLSGQLISSTYTDDIAYSDLITWLGSSVSATLELTLYTYNDAGMTSLVGSKTATATIVNGILTPTPDFIKGSMYPKLFGAGETVFMTNGITTLADTISCKVTEERNGAFELEMVIATTTPYFDQLQIGCLVVAKPNHTQAPQPFEVYEISKPINQKVTVRAHHISYRASFIPVTPFSATGITDAIIGLNANSQEYNPFIISTDITNEVSIYKQTVPGSLRSRLGGSAGSLLDTFGGEFLWDNWNISLRKNRGTDNGVQLRLGKNILALEQTLNFERVMTGALPYWTDGITAVYGQVQHSASAGDYAYARTTTLDLSDKFDTEPTVAQLNQAANTYISNSNYATPSNNIKVRFVDLADTEEYKNSPLERVNLCDTVSVIYEALNISYKAKVIKIVYDALADRTLEAEIGAPRSTLGETISGLAKYDESGNGGNSATAFQLECWPTARPTSANDSTNSGKLYHFLSSSTMTTGKPAFDGQIIMSEWDDSSAKGSQIFFGHSSSHNSLGWRGSNSSTWLAWAYADLRRRIWAGTCQGGSSVSVNCSAYTYLKIYAHCYDVTFAFTLDLTTAPSHTVAGAAGNTVYRATGCAPLYTTGAGTQRIENRYCVCEVNAAKTSISVLQMGFYYSSGTRSNKNSDADYYIFKIEGYL